MDMSKFKALLDEQMSWPDYYSFKFVIKSECKAQLLEILSDHKITEKLSKNGKYTSVTSRKLFNNSDEILEVYNSVNHIEGIIHL